MGGRPREAPAPEGRSGCRQSWRERRKRSSLGPASRFVQEPSPGGTLAVRILPTRHNPFRGTGRPRGKFDGMGRAWPSWFGGTSPGSSSVSVPWHTGRGARRRCRPPSPAAGADGRGEFPVPATPGPAAQPFSSRQVRSFPGNVLAVRGPRGISRPDSRPAPLLPVVQSVRRATIGKGSIACLRVLVKRRKPPADQLVGL